MVSAYGMDICFSGQSEERDSIVKLQQSMIEWKYLFIYLWKDFPSFCSSAVISKSSRTWPYFQTSRKNQNRVGMAEHSPEMVTNIFLNVGSNMGNVSLLVWICDEQLGFKYLVG